MKKGQNGNKPAKGSQIKVEPIKKIRDINSIKKLLNEKPLYSALFVIGINTALRASDLLRITVEAVKDLQAGDSFEIKEKKTGKVRRVTCNKACAEAIKRLLITRGSPESGPLFVGQRGPLTVPSVTRLVKSWCAMINLKSNYGSHSLRKTWGYHQRVTFNTDIPTLMSCFGHSSQKQTLEYLCIQPEEIKSVYNHEL
jgi:integrase